MGQHERHESSPTAETSRRGRDLGRVLTFVDAVVAIAMTLLVLPLVDVASALQDGDPVTQLLRDHTAQLGGFALSFGIIARFWFAQHRVLRNVVVQDPVVTGLLLMWLMLVVFLPFPTALAATAGSQPATKVLYIGTMLLASTLLALMSMRVGSTPAIRDSAHRPDPTPSWTTTAMLALALLLSLLVPAAGYYPVLLLLLSAPLDRAWHRLRRS
ncbi:MAG: TMEM175 family protein [Mycobacteriaceae bacterium]